MVDDGYPEDEILQAMSFEELVRFTYEHGKLNLRKYRGDPDQDAMMFILRSIGGAEAEVHIRRIKGLLK
jgi:hypothetical protein